MPAPHDVVGDPEMPACPRCGSTRTIPLAYTFDPPDWSQADSASCGDCDHTWRHWNDRS